MFGGGLQQEMFRYFQTVTFRKTLALHVDLQKFVQLLQVALNVGLHSVYQLFRVVVYVNVLDVFSLFLCLDLHS